MTSKTFKFQISALDLSPRRNKIDFKMLMIFKNFKFHNLFFQDSEYT
jgi:hypothetical protein